MSRGIDYSGLGATCNRNTETGIRYGIIPQNEIMEAWAGSSEPDYGEPTCPKCGNDAKQFETTHDNLEPYNRHSMRDFVCADCGIYFGSDEACCDEPIRFTFRDEGYSAFSDSSGDVWVTNSPYYTRAQFCSPCAPGACYLMNPCDDGERAYCFSHDWFDSGKAPYPVYRVSDDTLVEP